MSLRFRNLLITVLVLLCVGARAAEPDAMQAVRLAPGEKLSLDGSLSHPAWQRAPSYTRFVEKDPDNGAAPPQATRVQVLFDQQALYVGITALDSAPELIRAPLVRTDKVIRTQDFVAVYIDAIGTRRSAQFFRVNAAGSTGDGIHTAADDSEDFAPDFDWDAATQRTAQGWTAVLRLPFASLRFAEDDHDRWRIMVARRLPREQFHLITSVTVPRDAPNFIANLQPLQGVALPDEHRFLTVRPSLTLRGTRAAEPGAPAVSERATEASLDIKWRPRAELLIDATLNPDFSQVALDVPQLAGNSRFALYFPEKRPFFFESADLLRSPTEAFYTRSFTQPRWGLRSTWRGSAWAGSAFAIDDRGGGLVLLPGAYGTNFAEQPASRSLSARGRKDMGPVQVGAVLAARRYSDDAGDRGDNAVLGPDVAWQIDDAWRLRGQWLHSSTSALDDGQGSLVRGRAVEGDRVFLKAWRQTDHSETNFGIDDLSADFRHDAGFVNQTGVQRISGYHGHGWRRVGPFNELWGNLYLEQVRDRASGDLVKEVLRPGLWGTAANNLEFWVEAYLHSALRTAPGAPLLQERYVDTGLVMTPAVWFPLVDTSLSIGRLADTVANVVRPGARWSLSASLRPLARLELEPSFSMAWLNEDGSRRYEETAAQLLGVWHFNARHNLRAILQRTTLDRRSEPGVQAYKDAQRVGSLTYTWRQSAGTLLYVGASHSRSGVGSTFNESEAFVKLQFDVDEVRAFRGS
jgi:Domain of unknown function (DUF5916)